MFCAIFLLLLLAPATSLEIVCGAYHTCVFERGQEAMKCWGLNVVGQLGYGNTNNNRGDGANEMGSNLPLLNIGTGFTVEAMTLGYRHSCAMSDDRAMKCFGSNRDSQLGFVGATTTGDALPFLEFGVDVNLSKIAAGQYHTCALSTDAALKCFGDNEYGQCGAGTNTTWNIDISGPPSQITAIDFGTNFTPVDVSTFYDHVCVLSQQQTVKCFGYNSRGQLGYGDTTNRGRTSASMGDGLPIVDLGSDFIVAAIATGAWGHSCALSTTKTAKCWGSNYDGQCGTPHSTETGDNLPVLEFGADFVPMQLALGDSHTCILSETATLICFGDNDYGQLGIANTTDVGTPSTLTGIDLGTDFVPRQVAAGWYHTCAVSTDDAIKCWGNNYNGQLGLGHTNDMGDEPNEMGDNLPFVDVEWSSAAASPTTVSPTTVSPTTVSPTTVSPTTAAPTSSAPTTASPTTVSPTTFSPTTVSPTSSAPTTAAPTIDSPTTASSTTASWTTASPTTASPTTTATSTVDNPVTTSQATSDGNEVERSLDGVDSLYQLSLASFLAFCLLLWCCAGIDGYFIRQNDYLRLVDIFSCALQASDMLSDCFFVVHVSVYAQHEADLFFSLLFYASIFFIVCPVSSTLYQLYRQIKQKWAANRDAAEWLKQHSKKLYLLSIVSGGAFSAVRLMNSGIFQWSTFSMGLSRREFKLFNTKRVWSVVVLENLPQLAIQGSFLWMSDSLSAVAISSIVFSLVSMLVTVLGLATDRDLFAHDKVTLVSVKVTGKSVADKHARKRCRTLKRHLRNDLSMMLEIHRKSLEVMKPARITDGVLLRFYIYDNERAGTAVAPTVDARQVITNAVSSGRFSDIVQQAWELSDAPVISDVKYQMFEDQSVATQQQIELAQHVDSNQRVRDVELEVVEHTQARDASI